MLMNMKMIFEIRGSAFASPATVTRAGVLYITDDAQWKNYVQAWLDQWAEGLNLPRSAEKMRASSARWARRCSSTATRRCSSSSSTTSMLCHCSTSGSSRPSPTSCRACGRSRTSARRIRRQWRSTLSSPQFGVLVPHSPFRRASTTARSSPAGKDTWKDIKFPHRGEVYDVFVDKAKKDFVSWSEIVPGGYDSTTTKMSLVTVPTMETVAISFWLDNLIPNKHAMMLIGAAGCGKTAMINGKLRTLPEDYGSLTTTSTTIPTPTCSRRSSRRRSESGKNFGPPGNKLIYFVDDLNMAMLDPYNTASNISLMRQHMGYMHIYDLSKLLEKVLLNTQYLAAMNTAPVHHQPACSASSRPSPLAPPRRAQHHLRHLPRRPPHQVPRGGAGVRQAPRAGRAAAAQARGRHLPQDSEQLPLRVQRAPRRASSRHAHGQARAVPGAAQDRPAVAARVGASTATVLSP